MKTLSIILSSCFILAILPHCYRAMAEEADKQVCHDGGPTICMTETLEI